MDLVTEDDRLPARQAQLSTRFCEKLLAFAHAGAGAVDFGKAAANHVSDHTRYSGFPGARAAPEDHGGHAVGFDKPTKDAGGADQILPVDFIEGVGPHTFGKRGGALKIGNGFLLLCRWFVLAAVEAWFEWGGLHCCIRLRGCTLGARSVVGRSRYSILRRCSFNRLLQTVLLEFGCDWNRSFLR